MRKRIFTILTIVFAFGLGFSAFKIVSYFYESSNTSEQTADLINDADITEVSDNEQTEVIEQDAVLDDSNPYWDYVKQNLIDVDFEVLNQKNSDTKGWIQVAGTNINYPFVQTQNNDYYLTHSFDKTVNSAGWVFMDYRNNISNSAEKNTILYAHGRWDKTMFGSLQNILSDGWLDNKDNYIIKMSTPNENTLWQIFSVYQIPTTSDYLKTNFTSDEEFNSFIFKLMSRSAYNFKTAINKKDRILTLSTCYNQSDKLVVHAKLIKREARTRN